MRMQYEKEQQKPNMLQLKPQPGRQLRPGQSSQYNPVGPSPLMGHYSHIGNRAAQRLANPYSIPEPIKTHMEKTFQTDFSDVRVHPNSHKAQNLDALAYTQGQDIHFAPGMYNTGTESGKSLLGHELAHIVQQREGRVNPGHRYKGAQVNIDPGLEHEADRMGARATLYPAGNLDSTCPAYSNCRAALPGTPPREPADQGSQAATTMGAQNETATNQAPIQGVFKHIKDLEFEDEDTGERFTYQKTFPDPNNDTGIPPQKKYFALQSKTRNVIIDADGNLVEDYPIPEPFMEMDESSPEPDEDDLELMDLEEMDVSSPPSLLDKDNLEEGVILFPEQAAAEGLKDLFQIGKLSTDLTFQIALLPIEQGQLSAGFGFSEYMYTPNQVWVKSIKIGDKDRPETRFKKQESHTVAWTLVRHGLMGLAGQTVEELLKYLDKSFTGINDFAQNEEARALYEAAVGKNTETEKDILKSLDKARLPIDRWQYNLSILMRLYTQVYQLSTAATYKRGKALGHGEASARNKLLKDEADQAGGKTTRPTKDMAKDMSAMLDVQFQIGALGVAEYAFAVSHWIEMLQHTFPNLMSTQGDVLVAEVLNKPVSKSFREELGIPSAQTFTVKDLLQNKGYSAAPSNVFMHREMPGVEEVLQIEEPSVKQLYTNFTANIGVAPLIKVAGEEQEQKIKISETETRTIKYMAYPINSVGVSHVMISDQDRPKTKFLTDQKSHTVPWTLARNTILKFYGQPLEILFKFLEDEYGKLKDNILLQEGKEIVANGLKLIDDYHMKNLPVHIWQELVSELVRCYFVAYQVADPTTYINPEEADRALGHGEAVNMQVLRRNEYTIENENKITDPGERIVKAAVSLFDVGYTPNFPEKNIKIAYNHLIMELEKTFPQIHHYFFSDIESELLARKIGMGGRTLREIMEDKSI